MNKFRIRFFFEYGGGCLWGGDERTIEEYGYPIKLEILPLKKSTLDHLKKLETLFQSSLNWDDPASVSPWSKEESIAFKNQAEQVLISLKAELHEKFEIHNEIHLWEKVHVIQMNNVIE
jgi:hypothetical protein